jgi:hypothetical protein
LLLVAFPIGAMGQVLTGASASSQSNAFTANYSVTSIGTNGRVWQRAVPIATNEQGQVSYGIHSYIELATGMNRFVNGNWVPSSQSIATSTTGGAATNAPHQVFFSTDINSTNAVQVLTPDGKTLSTHVMGISYLDSATGSNVLIGQLQDAAGWLVRSNRVVYSNAFDGGSQVDIRYTYTKAGLEQDLLIRQQLADPSQFNLDPATTRFQLWTEFFDSPIPTITQATNGDQRIDFGIMKMAPGRAFMVGSPSNSILVRKQWVTVNGRTFLVEDVPFSAIAAKLQTLPASAGGTSNSVQQGLLKGFPKNLPPPPSVASRSDQPLRLAAQNSRTEKALVMDYDLVSSGYYGDFTFSGDTTFLIDGPVYFSGTTTIEPSSVIKFTDGSDSEDLVSLSVENLNCPTAPYQTATMTSADDNSVGEAIGSGSPVTASYNFYLDTDPDNPMFVSNLRIAYAATGVDTYYTVNCQFYDCTDPVLSPSYDGDWYLVNDLFSGCATAMSGGGTIDGYDVTFDGPHFTGGTMYGVNLNNCILTGDLGSGVESVSTLQTYTGTGTGIFQSAGAGNYYLPTNSIYHGAGSGGGFDGLYSPNFGCMTTYAPIVLTNLVTSNLTLSKQALRDPNNPDDVGYHYWPIDYLISCTVSNAAITLTNGVAVGYYDNRGIGLNNGGQLVSWGLPNNDPASLNDWVYTLNLNNVMTYAYSVQEQPGGNPYTARAVTSLHANFSNNPSAFLRFTTLYAPMNEEYQIDTDGSNRLGSLTLRDCEIFGAGGTWELGVSTNCAFGLTNNLFQYTQLSANVSGQFSAFNNLFLGSSSYWGSDFYEFAVTNNGGASIINRDNAFDGATVNIAGTNGHNAYVNGAYAISPVLASDIVTNISWQPGALGNYYQPGASPLLNAGSRSGPAASLYHYTVLASEAVEGTNTVSIGYHYVAVDGSGNPLDTGGNGPDYLIDANGNGVVDFGEMDWADYMPPLPGTQIQVYTPLKQQ